MANQIVVSAGAKVRNLQDVIIGTSGVLSSVAFDVANGVPRLDVNGKILVSQLPNSVMEYKGVWNAATNTPTLVNGTGNQGDVYLCNVAGTVDFGAGPITFFVGDQVIYSGTIWQRASGATGSVTSVAVTESGDSLNITGSPITTSGTINIGFNGTNLQYVNGAGNLTTFPTLITSIGLSMPSAFSVANSPLTANGTIAVTGAGVASQYIRGDGTLANFPTSGGGGSSVAYYFNGSVNQGTFVGNTYYEMSKVPVIGTGTDFTINADGYISQFITDANDPALLEIPAGNWNFEMYFSASSGGGSPSFYVELYKYNGSAFTLIASSSAAPEGITNGTAIDLYNTALAVPNTVLTLTDRLAVRVYVTHSGRTITLHTENSHLCEVITTFSTGITALNGLTAQVQFFGTGTSGTDFNISSTTATHTFNLPTASAANRGALSSADWSTFNGKQSALTLTTTGTSGAATLVGATLNIPQYQAAGTYVTSVTASAPLSSSGSTNPNITISQVSSTVDGYLSFSDYNVFSGKISGSGTAGYITRYTGSGSTIGNSGLYDDGTTVSLISRALSGSSASFASSVTATSFVKTGGTSAQFLKADGSVDSSTYLTTSAAASTYQTILTNPVTGTGTTNYLPKFTGTSSIANSIIYDNSGNVLINTTDASIGHRLAVYSATEAAQLRVMGLAPSVLFTESTTNTNSYSAYIGVATSVNNFVTGTGIGDYVMANNSNYPLVFATNGSIKMKMFANGNLTVGTTTDSGYKLDVNGTGRFSGALNGTSAVFSSSVTANGTLNIQRASGGATTTLQFKNEAGANRAKIVFGGSVEELGFYAGDGSAVNLTIASTGAATFSSSVTTNANEGFIIAPSSGASYINYKIGATSYSLIGIAGATNDFITGSALGDLNIRATNSQKILFSTNNGGSAALTIASTGNVLIGTSTDAGQKLQVNGTILAGGSIKIPSTSYFIGNATYGYRFNNGADSVTLMTILDSGNVGIGASTPPHLLSLYKASGEIYVSITQNTTDFLLGVDSAGLLRLFTSGSNSMSFWTNSTERMRIKSNGIINFSNVPTSASGLSSGDVYKSAGVLMIV